jgi:predicted transcriptional regulator
MPRVPKIVRLPPDTAAAMDTLADYEGFSQNEWIIRAIELRIAERRANQDYMTGLAKHFAGKLEQLDKP